MDLAKATGCRRCDISKIRPCDFRIDEKGNLWLDIHKSIGRIQEIIKDLEPNKKIFSHIHAQADIHAYRGEFARALYHEIVNNNNFRDDVYCVSQALGHNRLDVTITHYFK